MEVELDLFLLLILVGVRVGEIIIKTLWWPVPDALVALSSFEVRWRSEAKRNVPSLVLGMGLVLLDHTGEVILSLQLWSLVHKIGRLLIAGSETRIELWRHV